MLWVGLTGGIASGKSTVSRMLREAGAFIIDADELAHAALQKGETAYMWVVRTFGNTVLNERGEIDRAVLGKEVFGNATWRQQLEQQVHPYVFQKAQAEKEEIARQYPDRVVVFDAALLIETEAYRRMDGVLLVYVDRSTQIQRLMWRDGFLRDAAEQRINAQMPLDEKRRYASVVIDNMKTQEETRPAVMQVYARMEAAAARGENRFF